MPQDNGGREGREEVISSFPLLSPTTSLGWFLLWSKSPLYPLEKDPSFSEAAHCSLASWCLPTPGPSVLASGEGPSVMGTQRFSLPSCPASSPFTPKFCSFLNTPGPSPPSCPCPHSPYCPECPSWRTSAHPAAQRKRPPPCPHQVSSGLPNN